MNPKRPELPPALARYIAQADAALARALPAEGEQHDALHRAMHYAALGPGKRLRPMLVYATGNAFGAGSQELDASACAVELIHAYSLVHDDLPAMDNDELRRGRPTCHVAFGEAMAILAGDALQALAFEVLAADTAHDASVQVQMLSTLARACGAEGMAGGQALDLAATGRSLSLDALDRMHAHKTGALIRASVRLGALAAACRDAAVLAALDRAAALLGLAFQVRDDILDVEGESAVLGKTAGKDAAAAKPTYPALIGMAASRARLRGLTDDAIAELSSLPFDTAPLLQLAAYVADRDS